MKRVLLLFFITTTTLAMMEEYIPQSSIRVMTYNIRRDGPEDKDERKWTNRWPLVKKLIENAKPALIGLQEVTELQQKDLSEQMTMFNSVGTRRGASWWGFGADEANPIFYNTDQIEVLESETFQINTSKSKWGWTPFELQQTGFLPRICTFAKCRDKRTKRQFIILNTHLDNKFDQARLAGLAEIKNFIATKLGSSVPIILMGDFNEEFNENISTAIADFTSGIDMAKQIYGPSTTRTGWHDEELKTIDHILIHKQAKVQVLRYEIIESEQGMYPSDHRPVMADIVFDEK